MRAFSRPANSEVRCRVVGFVAMGIRSASVGEGRFAQFRFFQICARRR